VPGAVAAADVSAATAEVVAVALEVRDARAESGGRGCRRCRPERTGHRLGRPRSWSDPVSVTVAVTAAAPRAQVPIVVAEVVSRGGYCTGHRVWSQRPGSLPVPGVVAAANVSATMAEVVAAALEVRDARYKTNA
jgi:hypothetical protein